MWWILRLASAKLRGRRGRDRTALGINAPLVTHPRQQALVRHYKKVDTTTSQLQKKYKHAEVFGIKGNSSKATIEQFDRKLHAHVTSEQTVVVVGQYRRGGIDVVHHVDPVTNISVMTNRSGKFITAWQFSPGQARHVLETGVL